MVRAIGLAILYRTGGRFEATDKSPNRAPLKTLITVGWLNFSHLRLEKTLTARQVACVFCKSNLTKTHLAGRRDSF